MRDLHATIFEWKKSEVPRIIIQLCTILIVLRSTHLFLSGINFFFFISLLFAFKYIWWCASSDIYTACMRCSILHNYHFKSISNHPHDDDCHLKMKLIIYNYTLNFILNIYCCVAMISSKIRCIRVRVNALLKEWVIPVAKGNAT